MTPSNLFPSDLLHDLGVLDVGYSEEDLPRSFKRFEDWTNTNEMGPLTYLLGERAEWRKSLKSAYPEFQSAMVFLFSYQSAKKWLMDEGKHGVAGYTVGFGGEDYHRVLRRRLESLAQHLKLNFPKVEHYISLDAEAVLERDLAFRAGLGWFGKNSMLINQKEGSYFIIGSLLLNQKLPVEKIEQDTDHCGSCNACVEACPTDAIDPETRTLNSLDCISTFTIEQMKIVDAPRGLEKSRGEVFGCDICQDVCPWNKKPLQRTKGALWLRDRYEFVKDLFLANNFLELKTLINYTTNRGFRVKLDGTVFDRPGRIGWLKNLKSQKR